MSRRRKLKELPAEAPVAEAQEQKVYVVVPPEDWKETDGPVYLSIPQLDSCVVVIPNRDDLQRYPKKYREAYIELLDNGFRIEDNHILLRVEKNNKQNFKQLTLEEAVAVKQVAMALNLSVRELCAVLVSGKAELEHTMAPAMKRARSKAVAALDKYYGLRQEARSILYSPGEKSHEEINLLGRFAEQFGTVNQKRKFAGLEPLERPPEVTAASKFKGRFHYKLKT